MLEAHLWVALHRRAKALEGDVVQPAQHVPAARVALGRRVVLLGVTSEAAHQLQEALRRRKVGHILQHVLLSADELVRLRE